MFCIFLLCGFKDFARVKLKLLRDFFKSFLVQNLNVCSSCRHLAYFVRKRFCIVFTDENLAFHSVAVAYVVDYRIAFADVFFKDCKSRIICGNFYTDALSFHGNLSCRNTACRRLRIRTDETARAQFYSAEVSRNDNCSFYETLLANDVKNGLPRRAGRLSVVTETSDVAKIVRNVRIAIVRCVGILFSD